MFWGTPYQKSRSCLWSCAPVLFVMSGVSTNIQHEVCSQFSKFVFNFITFCCCSSQICCPLLITVLCLASPFHLPSSPKLGVLGKESRMHGVWVTFELLIKLSEFIAKLSGVAHVYELFCQQANRFLKILNVELLENSFQGEFFFFLENSDSLFVCMKETRVFLACPVCLMSYFACDVCLCSYNSSSSGG